MDIHSSNRFTALLCIPITRALWPELRCLGSGCTCDVSYKPSGRTPLLSMKPAIMVSFSHHRAASPFSQHLYQVMLYGDRYVCMNNIMFVYVFQKLISSCPVFSNRVWLHHTHTHTPTHTHPRWYWHCSTCNVWLYLMHKVKNLLTQFLSKWLIHHVCFSQSKP